jgi:hypothetical protein
VSGARRSQLPGCSCWLATISKLPSASSRSSASFRCPAPPLILSRAAKFSFCAAKES